MMDIVSSSYSPIWQSGSLKVSYGVITDGQCGAETAFCDHCFGLVYLGMLGGQKLWE